MTVFSEVYASHYDGFYASKNYQTECDLVEDIVKRYASENPNTVLDVGCGTGGHSIELAKRGFIVTGVDLSQSMLNLASEKSKLNKSLSQPRWVCGDVRNFDTGHQHDLAIMMFAVIGYLTGNSDVLSGLRNVRRHLKTGGLFICDFWSGPSVLAVQPSDRIREVEIEGGKVIRAASTILDIVNHTADVNFKLWTIIRDRLRSETKETHHLRYFFPQEFKLFLSNAGFELKSVSAFPSLDKPLTTESWNALIVAVAV